METERDNIDIDYERIETEMETMKAAMDAFSLASTDVFTSELATFEPMNSDFVEKYTRIVESLRDHHITNLNNNMSLLYQEASDTLQDFKEKDEAHSTNQVEITNG